MLFEIKPVALKAMVVAVVTDVALFPVLSVPSDPPNTLVIDEEDLAIGQALDGGIMSNDAIEVGVNVSVDEQRGGSRCS